MSAFEGTIGRTLADSEPHFAEPPHAGDDAPNVVIVLLDDTGFAQFGCYGSDIDTPNVDALAAGGVQFTNFHVTPLVDQLLQMINDSLGVRPDRPFVVRERWYRRQLELGVIPPGGVEAWDDLPESHRLLACRTTGWVEVSIDGEPCGTAAIPFYMRMVCSVGSSVGEDHGSAVSARYQAPFGYTGTLHEVAIQLPRRSSRSEQTANATSEMARQ